MPVIQNQIQKQLKKRPWEILILALAFAYLILDVILFEKNPSIIININNILNPLLAITVAVVALLLARKMGPGNPNRPLWSGLSIGWVFWAIAEILYTIPLFIGKETTYPSAADIFWVIGYFPMFFAFLQRQRVIPVELSRTNKLISLVIALLVIGFTGYYILLPVLRVFNPNETMISILNLLYPLLDLTLLLLVLRSFFAFVQGTYGQARLWVAIGFFFKAFSDLIHCYLRGITRYYHYGLADFPSVFLVDYTHTLGYLFFLLGLIILGKVPMFSTPHVDSREDNIL